MKTKPRQICRYIVKIYNKNTPDKKLIADLRETAKRLEKNYITMEEYSANGKFSAGTLYTRFCGWNSAIRLAGLTVQRNTNPAHDELMLNLKKVWDTLGRQPKYAEMMRPISIYGKGVYTNRYGSWLGALDEFVKFMNRGKNKLAGYKPDKILHNRIVSRTPKRHKLVPGRFNKRRKKLRFSKNIHAGMRFKIFSRDNFRCRICGRSPASDPKVKLHVDHIIPRSKGGETNPANLQTLCDKCNLGKGAKTMSN
jgi:hypothetical protein